MKFIGPAILFLVLLLSYAIIYKPDWVWGLGGFTVAAVFLGIILTIVAEVKEQKGEK